MYQKYIKRKGKKTGPYYYESFRLKNGKVKTIYLGKTPNKERLAEAIKKWKISVADVVVKGESVVVPLSNENRMVRDALALAEIFKGAVIKAESKIILPRLRLPKFEVKEIDLFKWFRKQEPVKEDKEQKKLDEYLPKPHNSDFNFEVLLFMFVSLAYVAGFFYLEGSITSYSFVSDVVAGHGSYFPILMGAVNLVLILLIYLDLRKVKKWSVIKRREREL